VHLISVTCEFSFSPYETSTAEEALSKDTFCRFDFNTNG